MARCIFRLIVMGFLFCFAVVGMAQKKKVLVLHSYHQGLKWSDNISKGILDAFSGVENTEILFEYLDTKRNSQESYFQELSQLYGMKLNNRSIDVVIAVDNNALRFVRMHSEGFFKDVPVVFCGINHFSYKMIENMTRTSGVIEELELTENIDLILRLHPNTRNIVVINDNKTTSGRLNIEFLKEYQKQLPEGITFTFYDNYSLKEMYSKISKLGQGNVILMMIYSQDKNSQYISYRENIQLISKASKVPIYGTWEFFLGEGVIGGRMSSGVQQGQIAGRLSLKALRGENLDTIPVIREGYMNDKFDYLQMQRFGIVPAQLPEGSVIINQPPTFYQKSKVIFWIIGAFIVILVVMSGYYDYSKRRDARRLMGINRELDVRVERSTRELRQANEKLKEQKAEISLQNEELEAHRHRLLELVEERTSELSKANEALNNSYNRLLMMLEANSDGVWEHNLQTDDIQFSSYFWEELGYTAEEISESIQFLEKHIHPADLAVFREARRAYLEGESEYIQVEFRIRNTLGNHLWLLARGKVLDPNEEGNPLLLVGTYVNITQRKIDEERIQRDEQRLREINREIEAQNIEYESLNRELRRSNENVHLMNEQIRASERRWRSLIEQATDEILLLDLEGNILDVNPSTCKKLGIPKDQLLFMNLNRVVHGTDTRMAEGLRQLNAQRPSSHFEVELESRNGHVFPVEITFTLIDFSETRLVLVVSRDISKRQEDERRIIHTIMDTEEKERKRFAADLHDSIGPLLSSIKLYLGTLLKTADTARKEQVLQISKEAVDEALFSIREISNNLSPQVLTDFGLVAALGNFCNKINVSGDLKIDFSTNLTQEERPDHNVEIVIYRISTELINNTIKHAHATKVQIVLNREHNRLSFGYQDNGQGFKTDEVAKSGNSGMGMSNIESRVKSVSGTFHISSEPGKGVVVDIQVPFIVNSNNPS